LRTKEEIFGIIKRNLLEIIPDLSSDKVDPSQSMKDLGANSVDRADVVIQTKEELGLKFPLHELGAVENIQGLVDFFHAECAKRDS
jgi:polyketide biosynthesis acyl carrier protein